MLSLENASVRKGDFSLHVGNLRIEDGETVAVMGVSGSGKTTLLEVLSGLEEITSGDAVTTEDMAFGYQNPYLQFFTEKVSSEILFSKPKMDRKDGEKIVDEALSQFLLDPSFREKSPYELSGGEARRVLLAAITSDDRPYLFLDECLSGLDEKGEEALRSLFLRREKAGQTTIFTSHDSDFSALAERLLIIRDGELVFDGKTRDILSSTARAAEYGLHPTFYATVAEEMGMSRILTREELVEAIVRMKEESDEN